MGIDAAFDKGWRKYFCRPQFHALTTDDIQGACQANNLDFSSIATNVACSIFRHVKRKVSKKLRGLHFLMVLFFSPAFGFFLRPFSDKFGHVFFCAGKANVEDNNVWLNL
ncbi:MAG: hypothetical protein CSA25_06830 [Desulfobacter postgatei]|uniref:Uncharacterized protein n=1 Tax=Desulfobacter postgatei TaxID=2293 RepID=A0A2G6MPY4_9BACT|nr:MAG: hypothetical protein CSA25_06830 [Desulfobacter postgatei]